jgi:hypothetical protein
MLRVSRRCILCFALQFRDNEPVKQRRSCSPVGVPRRGVGDEGKQVAQDPPATLQSGTLTNRARLSEARTVSSVSIRRACAGQDRRCSNNRVVTASASRCCSLT